MFQFVPYTTEHVYDKKGGKSCLKKYKWAAQMDKKWAAGWDETMLGLRG